MFGLGVAARETEKRRTQKQGQKTTGKPGQVRAKKESTLITNHESKSEQVSRKGESDPLNWVGRVKYTQKKRLLQRQRVIRVVRGCTIIPKRLFWTVI